MPEFRTPNAKLQPFQNRSWRIALLRVALLLTISGSLVFLAVNIHRHIYSLVVIQGATALFSLGMLIRVRRAVRYSPDQVLLFLLVLFVMLLASFLDLGTTQASFVWITVIPILAYQLLGSRKGLWLSLLFLSAGFVGFSLKQLRLIEDFPVIATLNFALATFCITVFSHIYETKLEESHRLLFDLASTDALTGLLNRSRFTEAFEYESSRAYREQTPLGFAIIDLDYFKQVNDRFGHGTGDVVLQQVAQRIQSRLRATDSPCRLGGEEFGVLFPGATSEQAASVIESIRKDLEQNPIDFRGTSVPVTITAGVAELGRDGYDLKTLYRVADQRLYTGKSQGRNQVTSE